MDEWGQFEISYMSDYPDSGRYLEIKRGDTILRLRPEEAWGGSIRIQRIVRTVTEDIEEVVFDG